MAIILNNRKIVIYPQQMTDFDDIWHDDAPHPWTLLANEI